MRSSEGKKHKKTWRSSRHVDCGSGGRSSALFSAFALIARAGAGIAAAVARGLFIFAHPTHRQHHRPRHGKQRNHIPNVHVVSLVGRPIQSRDISSLPRTRSALILWRRIRLAATSCILPRIQEKYNMISAFCSANCGFLRKRQKMRTNRAIYLRLSSLMYDCAYASSGRCSAKSVSMFTVKT